MNYQGGVLGGYVGFEGGMEMGIGGGLLNMKDYGMQRENYWFTFLHFFLLLIFHSA